MRSHTATLQKDGTLTLPEPVRERLGVSGDDGVVFVLRDDGAIELRRKPMELEDVFGSIPGRLGMSADLDDEIAEAMEEALAEKYKHFRR